MMVMVAVRVVGGVWCVVACGFLFLLLYIFILIIFTYFISYFPNFPGIFFVYARRVAERADFGVHCLGELTASCRSPRAQTRARA